MPSLNRHFRSVRLLPLLACWLVVATTIARADTSATVATGQAVTISVTANGTAPFTYQWKKNGFDISGATSSTLSFASIQFMDAAGYSVAVSNSAGSTTSDIATLNVVSPTPPGVTTQPVDQSKVVGQSATFSVVASGLPAPTYQWMKNGVNVSGATSSSYTIPSVALTDGGLFSVKVTNSAGFTFSSNANLTVSSPVPPSFTTQPVNQAVLVGDPVTFTSAATGSPAPTYQWIKNGVNIAGETSASFTLPAASLSDSGATYQVIATNSAGIAYSNSAVLTVSSTSAPAFLTQPQSQSVSVGANVVFSVTVSGLPVPSLQWRKDGANLPGATGTSLALNNVQSLSAGTYSVVATNANGVVASADATLAVSLAATTFTLSATSFPYTGTPQGPSVVSTPAGATFTTGGTLSASAVGSYTATATATGDYVGSNSSLSWAIVKGSQPAPVITSAASISYGDSYAATANTGVGALAWSLGSGSTAAGAAINSSSGAVTYTSSGTVVIRAQFAGDANYSASPYASDFTLTIARLPASVSLSGLATTYNGSPKAVTATTSPAGLAVNLSYAGSATAPTEAGSYAVAATVSDPNYTGSAAGTLVIGKAAGTVTLTGTIQIADGSPKSVGTGTTPTGLAVGVTYNQLADAPSGTGAYQVSATINDRNYAGSATAVLEILDADVVADTHGLFDSWGYIQRNADLAAVFKVPGSRWNLGAYGEYNFFGAWMHYFDFGLVEGRVYDDQFFGSHYLNINPDLRALWPTNSLSDQQAGLMHWYLYGYVEGRLGRIPLIFDSSQYLARNPDVAPVWGTEPTTVWQHFILYGIGEARNFDDEFRVDEYLALNPDLQAVFGSLPVAERRKSAFLHWVRFGRNEGRPGRNP